MTTWGRSHRWPLLVLCLSGILAVATIWWAHARRVGYPVSVDEAGYLAIAENDRIGFQEEGIGGWVDAVLDQAPNAPLTPAMTSVLLVIDQGSLEGFIVLAFFLVLLAVAVYGIGERLAGPRFGALAALVVATMPGVANFSRAFVFALPAAALLACAVYAVLRAERLQRSGWAIAAGAAIGAMLLARTMTVAFVPGILVAALVALACRPDASWRRGLLNLGLLCLAAFAVAAPWYLPNFDLIAEYLTSFGYGEKSAEYGASHSILSWDRWTGVYRTIAQSDLYLLLAALVLAGLAVVLIAAIRRVVDAEDRKAALRELLGADAAVVAIVAAADYVALSSSRNVGLGFTLPVTVLLVPMAVLALRGRPRVVAPAIVVLAAIAVVNLAASFTFSESISRGRAVDVPAFGTIPVVDGAPLAVQQMRLQVDGPETRFVATDRGYLTAAGKLAETFVVRLGAPVVAFASRNRVVDSNSVMLAGLRQYDTAIPMAQLLASDGPTPKDFAARLSEPEFGLPQVVVTTTSTAGDFEPWVSQPPVEAAARSLGMRMIRAVRLPDGRSMRVWTAIP
jgi:4-amino-4-deoxy-L-arabinose transferase-like glycosyltransferase